MENLYTTISELIHSDVAVKYNINNMPTIAHIDNMQRLIHYILQPIRLHFGKPLLVNGGYRSYALWQKLYKLGRNPAKNSQHLYGEAVDFTIKDVDTKTVFNWLKNSGLPFDQLIYEYDSKGNVWLHLSYKKEGNRKQIIDNYKGC